MASDIALFSQMWIHISVGHPYTSLKFQASPRSATTTIQTIYNINMPWTLQGVVVNIVSPQDITNCVNIIQVLAFSRRRAQSRQWNIHLSIYVTNTFASLGTRISIVTRNQTSLQYHKSLVAMSVIVRWRWNLPVQRLISGLLTTN